MYRLSRFRKEERGTIALLAALLLPVLIGFLALAAEFGYGLLMQVENQRVADAAALSAALAYGNGKISQANLTAAATNIANLNGMSSATLTASLTTVPQDSSKQAIRVDLTRTEPLALEKVLSSLTSLQVTATSFAQIGQAGGYSGCVMSLATTGTGITISSNTNQITASNCNVVSATTISCSQGKVTVSGTSNKIIYGKSAPSGCNISGTTASGTVTDPLSSNTAVTSALSAAANASTTSPAAVTTAGSGSLSLTNNTAGTWTYSGCTFTVSNGNATMACPSGTHDFGDVTISTTLTWTNTGTPTLTFKSLTITNTTQFAGTATYKIANGLLTTANATFDGSSFTIGAGTNGLCGSYTFSICTTANTLTINGSNTYALTSAIRNAGSVIMGSAGGSQTNSFTIGKASDGNSISTSGGTVTLGDTGANSFSLAGNITSTSSASCIVLGIASNSHTIGGNIDLGGAIKLYDGLYAIKGYFAAGANGTSTAPIACTGVSGNVSISSTNATLAVNAGSTVPSSSGTCSGRAICIAGSYSGVSLNPPGSSSTYANLAVLLPSTISAGVLLTGSSNATFNGALYFPGAPLSITGSAALAGGTSPCSQLIASSLALNSSVNLTANNSCFTTSGGNSTSTKIVQ